MTAFDWTPSRETVIRPRSRQRSERPTRSISSTGIPDASAPPTSAPAEVPATQSTRTPCSSKTFNTPTCAMPRAAPPESASPSRGRLPLLSALRHIRVGFGVVKSPTPQG
jgi:hypothetical protein